MLSPTDQQALAERDNLKAKLSAAQSREQELTQSLGGLLAFEKAENQELRRLVEVSVLSEMDRGLLSVCYTDSHGRPVPNRTATKLKAQQLRAAIERKDGERKDSDVETLH